MRITKFLILMLIGILFTSCQQLAQAPPEQILITTTPAPTNIPVPTATVMPRIPVVIAVQNIRAGREIQSDMLATILYPADIVPAGAFDSIEFVVGKYARTDIYAEELVLSRKLVESNSEDLMGRDLLPVPIANRDIAAGEEFTRDMYHTAWIESFELDELGISESDLIPNGFVPNSATYDIQANTPILARDPQ